MLAIVFVSLILTRVLLKQETLRPKQHVQRWVAHLKPFQPIDARRLPVGVTIRSDHLRLCEDTVVHPIIDEMTCPKQAEQACTI